MGVDREAAVAVERRRNVVMSRNLHTELEA